MFIDGFDLAHADLPRWDTRPETLERAFHFNRSPVTVTHPFSLIKMGIVYRHAGLKRIVGIFPDMDGLRIGGELGTLAVVLVLRQETKK